ncbi:DUF262 domain-containing protein [Chishuiella sp.]|uniref:DUF262 domain-containing protein n=1 Tax=Chishuiella sp. TaxID=1969467 RepID=UPI0028AD6D1D|nr:DUF262 domain-containing protein [Chishuiella sp.]
MEFDNTSLKVGTISLSDLYSNNLNIPDFQRPYEWNERLVYKLFVDLDNHFHKNDVEQNEMIEFYLGSILLYEKDSSLQVIDGQQRLTTFLILDFILRKETSWLKNGSSFTFYNSNSIKNVKSIQKYIQKIINEFRFTKTYYQSIINHITLNVVIAENEERAFQFFDSLNSKGKKLDTINILKSYHLRELEGEQELQLKLASSFDLINSKIESQGFKKNKIQTLNHFVTLLWVRIFRWTKGNFSAISKDDLEDYFQDNAVNYQLGKNKLKLFPGIRNTRNTTLTLGSGKVTYASEYNFDTSKETYIDFNPLQPVQKGLGFFLSIETLEAYFDKLFINTEFTLLKKINTLVKQSFNDYFIHLYYICILSFYIKFENEKLEEFAFEIEQILGNKFLTLKGVRENSPIVLLRDELNVLQEIYLNIEAEMLLSVIRKFKSKIKINTIKAITKDDKQQLNILANNININYPIHTTRPSYIIRALKTYHNNADDCTVYTQLNFINIKTDNDERN